MPEISTTAFSMAVHVYQDTNRYSTVECQLLAEERRDARNLCLPTS